MKTLHTEALLLRSVDVGESDRILHLLTPRTGRLTVVAKGARRSKKRFPGTLDFFNHLRVQVERRRPTSMPQLQLARLERTFDGIRRESRRFALGCYLLELLDRLSPEGGRAGDLKALFDFALGSLTLLDETRPDAALRTLLELQALDALGLRPELGRCVRCGTPIGAARSRGSSGSGGQSSAAALGFHIADGGPVCCAEPGEMLLPVHAGTLRALEGGLRLGLPQLGRLSLGGQALAEARALVGRFLRFHVGIELRSEAFLEERLTPAGAGGRLAHRDSNADSNARRA
ncbi:MAG: DNA repair protein RecO [Myxococcota bacterium]|nr:DNA repair protein RecO [Myxococcota bacterium]